MWEKLVNTIFDSNTVTIFHTASCKHADPSIVALGICFHPNQPYPTPPSRSILVGIPVDQGATCLVFACVDVPTIGTQWQ